MEESDGMEDEEGIQKEPQQEAWAGLPRLGEQGRMRGSHQIEVCAAKPDDPSLPPRTNMVEERNNS